MKVELINAFVMALIEVMEKSANTKIKPGKPARKQTDIAEGDVSALVGLNSLNAKGSMSISIDKELALQVMQRICGEEHSKIDDDVANMVGELSHKVTHRAQKKLHEQGFDFEMESPLITSGLGHSIRHLVYGYKIILPFSSDIKDGGNTHIELCFDS